MKKFEYLVGTLKDDNIRKEANNVCLESDIFENLGNKGWDLVTIDASRGKHVFKREKENR